MKRFTEILIVTLLTLAPSGSALADDAISQNTDIDNRSQAALAVEEVLEGRATQNVGPNAIGSTFKAASGFAGYNVKFEKSPATLGESFRGISESTKSLLNHLTSWFLSRGPLVRLWVLAFIGVGLILRSLLARYRARNAAHRFVRDFHLARTAALPGQSHEHSSN